MGLGVVGILVGVFAFITFIVLNTILPLVLHITLFVYLDWNTYWFWEQIITRFSQILCLCIMLPITVIIPLINGKIQMWLDSVGIVIYSIWGLPLYLNTLGDLMFTTLSGIELQRSLLIIILLMGWGIIMFQSISSNMRIDKKDN